MLRIVILVLISTAVSSTQYQEDWDQQVTTTEDDYYRDHYSGPIEEVRQIEMISDPPCANFNESHDGDFFEHIEYCYSNMGEYNENATKFVDQVTQVLWSYKMKLSESFHHAHRSYEMSLLISSDWTSTLAHTFSYSESKVKQSLKIFLIDVLDTWDRLYLTINLARSNAVKKSILKKPFSYEVELRLKALTDDIVRIQKNLMNHVDNYGEIEKVFLATSEIQSPLLQLTEEMPLHYRLK